MGRRLEAALGILNGLLGDHLAGTGNGLATEMGCIRGDRAVPLSRAGLARAYPQATPRIVVLVHGVMCTETVWSFPDGTDYGSLLSRDLGYTPFYVRYNSGRGIADNGEALSRMLGELADAYPGPLEEIVLLGFSMGGLVVRSASHAGSLAGSRWLGRVRRAIYVGTPHRGAPLERVGRAVTDVLGALDDPYTRLLADVANLRSLGVKDLGDPRHVVPLLPSIRHYLVAGTLSRRPALAALFGDALVPVPSATDGHCEDRTTLALPPSHVKIVDGVGHLPLAHHPEVYESIRGWCGEAT